MPRDGEVVGVVSGELLSKWRKYAFKKMIQEAKWRYQTSKFALDYLFKHCPDGEVTDDVDSDKLFAAFKTQHKDLYKEMVRDEAEINRLHSELWEKTYDVLGINPDDKYSFNPKTGEVSKRD